MLYNVFLKQNLKAIWHHFCLFKSKALILKSTGTSN